MQVRQDADRETEVWSFARQTLSNPVENSAMARFHRNPAGRMLRHDIVEEGTRCGLPCLRQPEAGNRSITESAPAAGPGHRLARKPHDAARSACNQHGFGIERDVRPFPGCKQSGGARIGIDQPGSDKTLLVETEFLGTGSGEAADRLIWLLRKRRQPCSIHDVAESDFPIIVDRGAPGASGV